MSEVPVLGRSWESDIAEVPEGRNECPVSSCGAACWHKGTVPNRLRNKMEELIATLYEVPLTPNKPSWPAKKLRKKSSSVVVDRSNALNWKDSDAVQLITDRDEIMNWLGDCVTRINDIANLLQIDSPICKDVVLSGTRSPKSLPVTPSSNNLWQGFEFANGFSLLPKVTSSRRRNESTRIRNPIADFEKLPKKESSKQAGDWTSILLTYWTNESRLGSMRASDGGSCPYEVMSSSSSSSFSMSEDQKIRCNLCGWGGASEAQLSSHLQFCIEIIDREKHPPLIVPPLELTGRFCEGGSLFNSDRSKSSGPNCRASLRSPRRRLAAPEANEQLVSQWAQANIRDGLNSTRRPALNSRRLLSLPWTVKVTRALRDESSDRPNVRSRGPAEHDDLYVISCQVSRHAQPSVVRKTWRDFKQLHQNLAGHAREHDKANNVDPTGIERFQLNAQKLLHNLPDSQEPLKRTKAISHVKGLRDLHWFPEEVPMVSKLFLSIGKKDDPRLHPPSPEQLQRYLESLSSSFVFKTYTYLHDFLGLGEYMKHKKGGYSKSTSPTVSALSGTSSVR